MYRLSSDIVVEDWDRVSLGGRRRATKKNLRTIRAISLTRYMTPTLWYASEGAVS